MEDQILKLITRYGAGINNGLNPLRLASYLAQMMERIEKLEALSTPKEDK